MANPILNLFGGMPNNNTPFGNMLNMMTQFNEFRNNFQGDPRQKVQELLNSGQMSQGQYSQLQQMAQQFMGFMGR